MQILEQLSAELTLFESRRDTHDLVHRRHMRGGKAQRALQQRHEAALRPGERGELPEILGVYRMAGNVDYLLFARVPDMAAYDALYKRLIAAVELGDVSSSFVMEEIKNSTRLPLDYA